MAGVIASVSLHNKDIKKGRSPISTCKSNYILRQFDKTFNPSKHNIFLVRRADFLERKLKEKKKTAILDLDEDQEDRNLGLSASRLLCEGFLLSKLLIFK